MDTTAGDAVNAIDLDNADRTLDFDGAAHMEVKSFFMGHFQIVHFVVFDNGGVGKLDKLLNNGRVNFSFIGFNGKVLLALMDRDGADVKMGKEQGREKVLGCVHYHKFVTMTPV